MKTSAVLNVLFAVFFSVFQASPALQPDPPHECDDCAEWNKPHEPFKVFGNTYYVGVDGLSALLIRGDDGQMVLLDGGLEQSAPLIDQNIRTLGFRTQEVRLIVNSHAHYDHAGGIAALQRFTNATVAASPAGARALERGGPTEDDPQVAYGKSQLFPPVKSVRSVADGEVLRVGSIALTAHHTPGHTPGSTTWSWQSCEGAHCLNIVYADSLTAVSAPGFRFTTGNAPTAADRFRQSIATVEKLPCDMVFSTHPSASGMKEKVTRRKAMPAADPFIDSNACRTYAAGAMKRLDERIAEEKKAK